MRALIRRTGSARSKWQAKRSRECRSAAIDHETTANIGRFEGGGATNIVCDYVKLDAEARSIVNEKLDLQIEAMREAVESAAAEYRRKSGFRSKLIYPGLFLR